MDLIDVGASTRTVASPSRAKLRCRMRFPVLVVLPQAADCWEAYDAVEAAMEPFTLHPFADPDDVIVVDPEPAVRHYLAKPWEAEDLTGPGQWTPAVDPMDCLHGTDSALRGLASQWISAAVGSYAVQDPLCGVFDYERSNFGLRLGGSGRCDGWVLGGEASRMLLLRQPAPVVVVEEACEFGAARSTPRPTTTGPVAPRAGVGTPPRNEVSDARTNSPATAGQLSPADSGVPGAGEAVSWTQAVDLAAVSEVDPTAIRDVFDVEVTVVWAGRWWDFEMMSAPDYFALRRAVRVLPPGAWLAVLDAHM